MATAAAAASTLSGKTQEAVATPALLAAEVASRGAATLQPHAPAAESCDVAEEVPQPPPAAVAVRVTPVAAIAEGWDDLAGIARTQSVNRKVINARGLEESVSGGGWGVA